MGDFDYMKLVITGGGSGEKTKELDSLFASLLDKSKPLLYIPIAIDNIKHPYSECIKWLRSTFDSLGVSKYEMWTEADLEQSEAVTAESFSGIYIGGGNTPYLLNKIRNTSLDKLIKDALNQNIPLYGGSAGAVVFAKSIIPALYHDKNWVEIKKFDGFNVLQDEEITCHYSHKETTLVRQMMKDHNMSRVICLSERNGLYIQDNQIQVIGQEPLVILYPETDLQVAVGDELLLTYDT
jgi:dipeptidase E